MPGPQADSEFPRPPPSYDATHPAAGSSEALLGQDRGAHSEDDIPDDFKYSCNATILTI